MLNLTRQELLSVTKPARYVGGEYHQVIKNKENIKARVAFCFPDVYDIGMSNLGMKILYGVLNKRKDTWCERVFAPWPDFEALMRKKNIPLYGLESKDSIKTFDIIAFTLQYEMSYTNILNMLDLAQVPVKAKDRKEADPFVIAGGPCACNPAPLEMFIDIFLLGEGEELIDAITQKYVEWKEMKLPKQAYLESIKGMKGVYIPSLHKKGESVEKVVIENLNEVYCPTDFVVPSTEITQNRISLEVFRGCSRSCRFCQAGYIYRPVREKSSNHLINLAKESIKQSGINELSLCSLSTCDYTQFNELANGLLDVCEEKKVGLSLPSLRIDSIDVEMLKKIQTVRKSSLTFAPEAGSQRLRDVINKNITEEEILKGCKLAFENGWSNVKLYFMIGLPTETYQDLEEIVALANKIVEVFYAIPNTMRKGKCSVTVSTSTFVPKPHTPFQWCAQNTLDKIELKQQFLKQKLNNKNIKYNWHHSTVSMYEAVISRGDSKIGEVIYEAYRNGAKFDSWDEYFNNEAWQKAFEATNINPQDYASKEYDLEEALPWNHIMHGVEKEYLKREYKKAMEQKTTPRCSTKHCANCGITKITECQYLNELKKRE